MIENFHSLSHRPYPKISFNHLDRCVWPTDKSNEEFGIKYTHRHQPCIQKYLLSVVHTAVIPVKDFDLQCGISSSAMLIRSPADHITEFLLPGYRWAHIQCVNTKYGSSNFPEACSSVGSLRVHSLNELIEQLVNSYKKYAFTH